MSTDSYNQPIRISESLSIYSGDIITLNNSEPLLVEVVDEEKQEIKLRKVTENKYLYKSKSILIFKKPLKFCDDYDKFSIFIIKKNEQNKIRLKEAYKKEYLNFDKGEFYLTNEEKWMTIAKEEGIENIVGYEEKVLDFHKDKTQEVIERKIIARKAYDNKTDDPFEYNFTFSKSVQEEKNLTWSKEITLGAAARLSIEKLIGLEFSANLEEKENKSNSITKTKTRTIEDNLKLNCPAWKETRVKLEIRKISKEIPYTATIKRKINNQVYEYFIEGKFITDDYSESRCVTESYTARNILLVGWTGSGKSTLANVLSDSKDFSESNHSTSETKFFKKSEKFEYKDSYYSVIDNIGFGDNREIEERDVLIRIGEAINSAKEGLSHVLLVFDGKFSEKVKEDLEKLAALKITESLITIVRTRFENFSNSERCENDIQKLKKESPEIRKILNSCRKLLHVNNGKETARERSRKKVLNYLHDVCHDVFKPKEWDDINNLIERYLEKKESLEGNTVNQTIERQLEDLKTDTAKQIEEKIQEEDTKEFVEVIRTIN